MQRLAGRVAVITGGGSGIGYATAARFLAEGARVLITGRTTAKVRAAAFELQGAAGVEEGAIGFAVCDVRDRAACDRLAAHAVERFGRIDVLFNNAGIVPLGTALTTSDETWRDVFATNVDGLFYTSRAVLPTMIAGGGGVIVNNASDWAVVGAQNAMAYAATKGAVVQITRSMALDHARANIRVNAICPGDTYVDRWLPAGKTQEEYLRELGHEFPMGRVGAVEEIAAAVAFLASDDSRYMTGQLLIVDGGNTAGGVSARFGRE